MAQKIINKGYMDPVCGIKLSPAKAAEISNYKGTQIYFCATSCKKAFDADPKKFMSDKPKSFWSRYLDRLNKATGGRPPSCCS